MYQITEVDDYKLITFEHNKSSALIYVQKPQQLTFFQIEILENFFRRIIFYIGLESNLDVILEHLPNGEISVIAYFYNNQQDYDFSASFPSQFMAVHKAFSSLFEMSVYSQYGYDCINEDTDGDWADEEVGDYEKSQAMNQEKEKTPKSKLSAGEKERLAELGRVIDKLLKKQDKNWPPA